MATTMDFDPANFLTLVTGHSARLGIAHRAHGTDWCEMALPYAAELVGEPATGVLASGPIIALTDVTSGASIAIRRANNLSDRAGALGV